MQCNAVVLAAGKGTRMKSDLAKVLHELHGKALLAHVLETLGKLSPRRTVAIVGHQAEQVGEICRRFGVETALQAEQLGTCHAVQQAEDQLIAEEGLTLILCGDVPLISETTLRSLVDCVSMGETAGAVLTALTEDASGYGRILRDEQDRVIGIVEEKDATNEQRKIREYNTGTYCFRNDLLWSALHRIDAENAQGEYYLTDIISILVNDGHPVEGVICPDEREVQGINTLEDLARAHRDLEEIRHG